MQATQKHVAAVATQAEPRPEFTPLRTTPIGHSADPHSQLTNRKARRLVNEVEAHGLAWTYIDNKKALSIYLLRAL